MRFRALFISLILLAGCHETADEPAEVVILVPEIKIDADAAGLVKLSTGEMFLNDKPFSGYISLTRPDGSIEYKRGYYEGKLHGLSTSFYRSGSKKDSRPYAFGEKHGKHIGYYKDGSQKFQFFFEKGFSQGNHKEWYSNGELYSDMNYIDGKERGTQKVWREDGKLRANYVVRENGRRYGLQGIKRCTKLDGVSQTVDPYRGTEE